MAALTALASEAAAMETGECLPAAQVRAKLAVVGQTPIIVGNRAGYGYPTALIITSNADGSKGYMLRADKPFGQQADTVCIDSVFSGIRLNDVTKSGVPAWSLTGEDAAGAEAECKRERLGYQENCSANDVALRVMNGNGQSVLFVAVGAIANPRDQTKRDGQRIVITINAGRTSGVVMAVTPGGANYLLSAYTELSVTQNFEVVAKSLAH